MCPCLAVTEPSSLCFFAGPIHRTKVKIDVNFLVASSPDFPYKPPSLLTLLSWTLLRGAQITQIKVWAPQTSHSPSTLVIGDWGISDPIRPPTPTPFTALDPGLAVSPALNPRTEISCNPSALSLPCHCFPLQSDREHDYCRISDAQTLPRSY